jgi:hypothetical protein
MSYVGGEKGKDISDQELVTPCFKFLWESYKIVLEILRNNSKFEALYAVCNLFIFLVFQVIYCVYVKCCVLEFRDLTVIDR